MCLLLFFSKKIAVLPGTDSSVEQKLRAKVRLNAVDFLKSHVLTMSVLPSPEKYEELQRTRREAIKRTLAAKKAADEERKRQRALRNNAYDSPSSSRKSPEKKVNSTFLARNPFEKSPDVKQNNSNPFEGEDASDDESLNPFNDADDEDHAVSKQKSHANGLINQSINGWAAEPVRPDELDQDDDPVLQQIEIVRKTIEQARRAGRMDEVGSLSQNLAELNLFYRKQVLQQLWLIDWLIYDIFFGGDFISVWQILFIYTFTPNTLARSIPYFFALNFSLKIRVVFVFFHQKITITLKTWGRKTLKKKFNCPPLLSTDFRGRRGPPCICLWGNRENGRLRDRESDRAARRYSDAESPSRSWPGLRRSAVLVLLLRGFVLFCRWFFENVHEFAVWYGRIRRLTLFCHHLQVSNQSINQPNSNDWTNNQSINQSTEQSHRKKLNQSINRTDWNRSSIRRFLHHRFEDFTFDNASSSKPTHQRTLR